MSPFVNKSDTINSKLLVSICQNSISQDRSNLTNRSLKLNPKTPPTTKWLSASDIRPRKTPSKTPKKSPNKLNTPNTNSKLKTPSYADRFIPIRNGTQFELGHYKLTQSPDDDNCMSPSMKERQRIYLENLHGANISETKILSFSVKPPAPPEGHINPLKSIYSKTPGSAKSTFRHIPQEADRILDAPDMLDDYYLNLIDWGTNNILAVALKNQLYLWNASDGETDLLFEVNDPDIICSVSWLRDSNYLAVGTSTGSVLIWDCEHKKNTRKMEGHIARVPSLSWNSYVLSSGSRSGHINNHDVRQREHLINRIIGHSQEVCGLKWSTDGRFLASGGNDNVLNVWSKVNDGSHCGSNPLFTFNEHQSAIKALAWCPWQPHLLASGGGTGDRTIRFWNCSSGANINTVDVKSQVCSLVWSTNYRELVSGHGFSNNQLMIWKYPSMSVVAELTGHSSRVLNLALSPDGTTVVSAGADETLRIWKCFLTDKLKKKEKSASKKTEFESMKNSIR